MPLAGAHTDPRGAGGRHHLEHVAQSREDQLKCYYNKKKGHDCSLVDAANITAVCGAIWSLLATCSTTQPTQTCIGHRGAGAEARGGDDDRVRKRRQVITNPFGGDLMQVWRPPSLVYSTCRGL